MFYPQSAFLVIWRPFPFHTIGEPARDAEPPFPSPLDLAGAFPRFEQLLQSRSRSEVSNVVDDDVAESAAIFCSAFRRIFRDTLELY
jgi:hypothetical protein